MSERAFDFLEVNDRPSKPREYGLTEIGGGYYDPIGVNRLQDIFETLGEYVDIFKLSGGCFVLMEYETVAELIDICHEYDVEVSTGGFIEKVLVRNPNEVDAYLEEAAELSFDIVEVSSGFLAIDSSDLVALTERIVDNGMKAKPEVNVQYGAGGEASVEDLEDDASVNTRRAIEEANRHLDAGAYKIMIESDGITDLVREPRTDVAFDLAHGIGLENCMFEADDPESFEWYIKEFGPNVNLYVDQSQIAELECLRSGVWEKQDTFGRTVSVN